MEHRKIISWFPSVTDVKNSSPVYLDVWLTQRPGSKMLAILEQLRETDDKAVRDDLKSLLPVCTPSGVFSSRNDNSMTSFSGLIQIDVDGDHNKELDPEEMKDELTQLPYVYFAGFSASGKGVWGLVAVPDHTQWKERFNAIEWDIYNKTHIVLDRCTDVISQPRFYSYDADPYIRRDAKVFTDTLAQSKLRGSYKQNKNRVDCSYPFLEVPKEHFWKCVEFNRMANVQAVLEELGWIYTRDLNERSKNERLVYWTRPGKSLPDALIKKSGSVSIAKNAFFCHSTNAGIPDKEWLSPFDLLCILENSGNIMKTIRKYCQ